VTLLLPKNHFIILFPNEAHAPGLTPNTPHPVPVTKIVIKVKE